MQCCLESAESYSESEIAGQEKNSGANAKIGGRNAADFNGFTVQEVRKRREHERHCRRFHSVSNIHRCAKMR